MGGTQRLAAVAAISHARHYYNQTQPEVVQTGATHYNVNIFFVSATLCGVLVAVCAACWRRRGFGDKPADIGARLPPAVYTVSNDVRLHQEELSVSGPPPAYDAVVRMPTQPKDDDILQEVVTEPCQRCAEGPARPDSGLPSYEAAVLLRDTKL